MLRDEIVRYTELSGNDGEHTPIGIIGAYLDGYEKGLESRENKGEMKKGMIGIAKTIGRLIAVLVDAGVIEREQAVWIIEPLKDEGESEDKK